MFLCALHLEYGFQPSRSLKCSLVNLITNCTLYIRYQRWKRSIIQMSLISMYRKEVDKLSPVAFVLKEICTLFGHRPLIVNLWLFALVLNDKQKVKLRKLKVKLRSLVLSTGAKMFVTCVGLFWPALLQLYKNSMQWTFHKNAVNFQKTNWSHSVVVIGWSREYPRHAPQPQGWIYFLTPLLKNFRRAAPGRPHPTW